MSRGARAPRAMWSCKPHFINILYVISELIAARGAHVSRAARESGGLATEGRQSLPPRILQRPSPRHDLGVAGATRSILRTTHPGILIRSNFFRNRKISFFDYKFLMQYGIMTVARRFDQ